MRQYLGGIVGAVVGVIGGILFMQSMPPPEGSQAERAERAEKELRRAERTISELRAGGAKGGPRRTSSDGARDILADIRAGRDVDIDDLYQITKPWMRDLSPVMNRIRMKTQMEQFDDIAWELNKEYDLTEQQEVALRDWLEQKAEQNAAEFDRLIASESSTLVDFLRAGRDAEENLRGVDEFMESQLTGEKLVKFKADRLADRVESVQGEANGKLNRLDDLVDLDQEQEDQLFLTMVRGSRDYTPTMDIEGMGGSRTPIEPAGRNEAIRSLLRPGQRQIYDEHRAAQRREAEDDLREVGLKLPDDWDLMDEYDW